MANLQQRRFNYGPRLPSKAAGTFSEIILPSGKSIYTVERPWSGNKPYVSCIPEGVYTLRKRRSNVVEETTRGQYKEGWEVTDVINRTYIMFHPANWPHDLAGCIGPGLTYGLITGTTGIARLGVGSSFDAFKLFMSELESEDEHQLHILPYLASYP